MTTHAMTFELTKEERLLLKELLESYMRRAVAIAGKDLDAFSGARSLDVASGLFKKLSSK
jgi:hypothetical protein